MPPQDFSGLTVEELKAMEGNERANVEARIKCLRNIQVLLDAAVMEMQQYSSVVGQLDLTSRRSAEVITSVTTASSTTSSTTISNPKPLPTAETGARPKVKPDEKKNPDENSTSTNGISANENSNETEENDEQNEIRKRRLERFGATNQTSD